MKLAFDDYAYLDSVIHRWEQRSKFISLLALIFSFAFVKQLVLLPAMILATAILFYLSRLPFSFLLSRLRYPGIFIVTVVFLLPFLAGETVILNLGWLTLKQEGCLEAILIVTRFVCILSVMLVLFGTAPFLKTIRAMQSLGISSIIVDMMLLTYRYLEELGTILTNLQRAMKLRGFNPKGLTRRNLNFFSQLMGNLLIRSYEKSTRVYHCMILRGYHARKFSKRERLFSDPLSLIAFCLTVMIALTLTLAELFLELKI